MGGKTTSTTSPKLNGLQVQSSTLGLPISLGWLRNRTGNVDRRSCGKGDG